MDAQQQFAQALQAAGLSPPATIELDGKLHRFSPNGKRGDDSGWYVLHGDGVPAGCFGDWRTGLQQTWRADAQRRLSPSEAEAYAKRIAAAKVQRQEAERAQQVDAATRAAALLDCAAGDVSAHPYTVRKRVALGTLVKRGDWPQRGWSGALLIPLYGTDGTVTTVEAINDDGEKDFLKGGRKRGSFHPIGRVRSAETVLIGEGLATVAAAAEATGLPAVAAMDASNLEPVANAVRALAPDARIVLLADHDPRDGGNRGVEAAHIAASAVNGVVALPSHGSEGKDFWDIWSDAGAKAVCEAVERAVSPHTPMHANSTSGASEAILEGHCVLLRGDAIIPEATNWIWKGWLATGKFHLLAGQPGTGKTTVAMALAASITSGGRWPDGASAEVGDVLIWSGEDDPADTLVPRLIAMGADMTRVHFVDGVHQADDVRPFDPAMDVAALVHKARMLENVRLLIVDPVVSAVAGDSHKNAETRRSLQPLVVLAAELGCAVLGISHFSKGSAGSDPVERVTGSLAFAALARVVIVAAKMKAEDGERPRRMLARAKSNIGPDDGGFTYELQQVDLAAYPGVSASQVLWCGGMDGTARDLLAQAETTDDPSERSAIEEAMEFLRAELADGPLPAKTVTSAGQSAGHSAATIRRAKEKLGVRAEKVAMHGGWSWSLRPKMVKSAEDAQGFGLSTFVDVHEQLRGPVGEGAQRPVKDAQPEKMSAFGKDEHLRAGDEQRESF